MESVSLVLLWYDSNVTVRWRFTQLDLNVLLQPRYLYTQCIISDPEERLFFMKPPLIFSLFSFSFLLFFPFVFRGRIAKRLEVIQGSELRLCGWKSHSVSSGPHPKIILGVEIINSSSEAFEQWGQRNVFGHGLLNWRSIGRWGYKLTCVPWRVCRSKSLSYFCSRNLLFSSVSDLPQSGS